MQDSTQPHKVAALEKPEWARALHGFSKPREGIQAALLRRGFFKCLHARNSAGLRPERGPNKNGAICNLDGKLALQPGPAYDAATPALAKETP